MLFLLFAACGTDKSPSGTVDFAFTVAADIRNYTGDNKGYFRGVCEAIALEEPGSFMVSPGDIDPPADVYSTIQKYIGVDYT